MSTKQPIIFLLEAGRVDEGKYHWILSVILYLSINSSYWPLLQTGLSKMDLFSNSVRICFTFLAKIKGSSKTERSKIISLIKYMQCFYTVLDKEPYKGQGGSCESGDNSFLDWFFFLLESCGKKEQTTQLLFLIGFNNCPNWFCIKTFLLQVSFLT